MWIPGERRLATVQERMDTFTHIAAEAAKDAGGIRNPQTIEFISSHWRPNSNSLKDYSTLDFKDDHGKRKFKSYITAMKGNMKIWDPTKQVWHQSARVWWEEYRTDNDMRMLIPFKAMMASLRGLDLYWDGPKCLIRDNQFDLVITHTVTREVIAIVVVDDGASPPMQHIYTQTSEKRCAETIRHQSQELLGAIPKDGTIQQRQIQIHKEKPARSASR